MTEPREFKTASDYTEDLRLAHVLADSVDSLTMDRFKALDLTVETKPDLTPVTDADTSAETLIRSQLARVRPRDSVLGEEFGVTGSGPRQWIVDPIDGTKNFVRGTPVWATLIALVDNGTPVVGLVSAPALGRRWWASLGGGAYTGRSLSSARRISVSRVSEMSDASFSYSSLTGWEERGTLDEFLDLTRAVWRTRAYGDFWSYCLVAEGAVDIAAEPELNLYDMAALAPIVTEAGGRFTDLEGTDGPFGANALASNGLLHDGALRILWPVDESEDAAADAPAGEDAGSSAVRSEGARSAGVRSEAGSTRDVDRDEA
ncbi:histidinol-phosphatase [Falsarthrobacter nasiphocae]|uniref:Histidinol-phosphatase n=1 Tax=Falsarthrobacter nasiphocae TaxID=189863 RepID=A0AAE4C8T4_9MICC|nr:histidinol-phosphatase [Falsarthrobacter nasiphocae]MDR6892735.1 histidinol-phosphatase [Falsarthrobacter nasiphocae]